jgi:hypothetical protein
VPWENALPAEVVRPGRPALVAEVRGVGVGFYTPERKILSFKYKTSDAAKARRAISQQRRRQVRGRR